MISHCSCANLKAAHLRGGSLLLEGQVQWESVGWIHLTNQRSQACDSDYLSTLVKQPEERQCPHWNIAFSYLRDHPKMPKAKDKLNPIAREAQECLFCSQLRRGGNWDS